MTIVKHIAGSNLYGLQTPESDLDERGIYANLSKPVLYGFEKDDSVVRQSDSEDMALFELRRWFQLLRKTNTNSIETLFCPRGYQTETTKVFKTIQTNRNSFIDSEQLLKSLTGYMHGEFRLMTGERTGKLGGKRKETLLKYGYSFKNLVHMKRLVYCAETFYSSGHFPTTLNGTELFSELMDIKLNPEKLNLKSATKIGEDCIQKLSEIKDTIGSEFNVDLACDILDLVYTNPSK